MAIKDGTGPERFDEVGVGSSGIRLRRWDGRVAWCPRWKWQYLNDLYESCRTFEAEGIACEIEEDLAWEEDRDPDEEDE